MSPPKPANSSVPTTPVPSSSSTQKAQPQDVDSKAMEAELQQLIFNTPRIQGDPYPSHELRVCNEFIKNHPSYEQNRTTVYVSYIKVFARLRDEGKLPPVLPASAPSAPPPPPLPKSPVHPPKRPDGKKTTPAPAAPVSPPPSQPKPPKLAKPPKPAKPSSSGKPAPAKPGPSKATATPSPKAPPAGVKKILTPLPEQRFEIFYKKLPPLNGESIRMMERSTQIFDQATLEELKLLIKKRAEKEVTK